MLRCCLNLSPRFKDGALASTLGSLGATGAGIIGDQFSGTDFSSTVSNMAAHAVLGCAAAAASKQDCGAGALGGAASAGLARIIDASLKDAELSKETREAVIAGGAVAGSALLANAVGKDALTAGNAAANEVLNNYLKHSEAKALSDAKDRRQQCTTQACVDTADKEIKALQDLDRQRNETLRIACQDPSSTACSMERSKLADVLTSYVGKNDGLDKWGVIGKERAEATTLASQYTTKATQLASVLRSAGELALDFSPAGDVKALLEANTKLEYALALVGALGPAGDLTKALVKEAKVALEAGDAVKAAEKMAEAERKLASGVYDPKAFRDYYDAKHGAENVTSTTVANAPIQRVNSNVDNGVTVTGNASGKAVAVTCKDPVTGQVSKANIPYDSRGLPIFDNVSKYNTTIDMTVPYEKQFRQATLDLRDAINAGKVDAGQFTAAQLKDIQTGAKTIDGYTWHHNAQSAPSNMQLVPTTVHREVNHIGQGSLIQGR